MPAFVEKNEAYLLDRSIPEPNSGCWLWLLSVNADGYAVMKGGLAHRLAARLRLGEVPPGKEVDHRCRVRSCVNPDHMRYLTHHENILAGDIGGHQHQSKKTHCPKGHPLSGDNLRAKRTNTRQGFSRQCRACERLRAERRKLAKKGTL